MGVAVSGPVTEDPRDQRTGSVLVGAQFALIGLCLLPVGPSLWRMPIVGLVVLVVAAIVGGLALRDMGDDVRVHPVPGADIDLHTSGVYSVVRHPMYSGVLLAALGVTLSSGRVLSLLSVVGLVIVLATKSRLEDRLLAQRFGAPFTEYAARVPALVPAPWRRWRS